MHLVAILSVLILGWCVTGLFSLQDRPEERLGLSFLLGLQIFTLALFLANYYLGIRLTFLNSWLVMLALVLAVLPFFFKRDKFRMPAFRLPASGWQKLFLAILVILCVSNLVISFSRPVVDWDAVTMFDYRAKIITDTGNIKDTLFRASVISYPLLTTMGHFWIMVNGGTTSMPLYPLFYIGFLLVAHSQIKRLLPEGLVLPGLLLLAVTPKMFDQSLVAYANLPYTVYLISGAAYLYLWTREKRGQDLFLGILLSLFSFWVRSFPFALGSLLALLLWHPKTRKATLAVLSSAGLFILIKYFDLSKLIAVLSFFRWSVMDYYFPYTWIFIGLAGWQLYSRRPNFYWLLTVLFYGLGFLAGTYFYSDINPDFAAIPDAAQRMLMFLPPAVLWYFYSLV